MLRLFPHWCALAYHAIRVDEVNGLVRGIAFLAHVSILVFSPALRACSFDIAIGKDALAFWAVRLLNRFFVYESIFFEGKEKMIRKVLVLGGICRVITIELYVEAAKIVCVLLMNFFNKLLRRNAEL